MNLELKPNTECAIEVDNSFVRRYIVGSFKAAHPITQTFVGKVIESPSHMKDYISFLDQSTGQIRYLTPSRIVGVNNTSIAAPPAVSNNRVFTFTSERSGEKYIVKHDEKTKYWSCTCKGFGFKKNCKHVDEAKSYKD